MPTNTTKFNLVKPLKSEKYNVDVFNGNADIIDSQIYSKSEVDTSLNGKAPTVHTHTKEQVGLSNVDNTSDLNKPISTATQSALNGKANKLFATNLVTNGDFSNGTTGWTSSFSTSSVSNKTLTNTGNGAQSFPFIVQSYPFISGRQYYLKATTKANTSLCTRISILFINAYADKMTPTNGVWNNHSAVVTADAQTNFGIAHYYLNSTNANGSSIDIKDILVLDLTETFGAGNEPTKEQMDKLLSVYPNSWFNGTSEIGSISALMRASLGVQVVTPTLLNSRTGTAQYVVSNDGLVIFRGTASGGSLNTNIFVLPDNIRPIATRTFPISANNAFGVITVAANGEVRQTVGALTNVFLDGIVFKVGM